MPPHPHIFVPVGPDPVRFTSPNSGRRDRLALPSRVRRDHAQRLTNKLVTLSQEAQDRAREQSEFGLRDGFGIYITFESEPNFELKFDSLDLTRSGIELCAVRTSANNQMLATVFVPDGKLDLFLRKVAAYRNENTRPRREGGPTRPKNQDLIESIGDIKLAALEALWTESEIALPPEDSIVTWEVWLRHSADVNHFARLRQYSEQFGLTVGPHSLRFIDREIALVRGTRRALSRSIDVLGMIAELRLAKTPASFFTDMTALEQRPWVENLSSRVTPPQDNAPYVCLLDTGLNHAHPLLAPAVTVGDLHTYNPNWGTNDQRGHGTPMAGLAVYGDLTDLLASSSTVPLTHKLESVKVLQSGNSHDADLYGAVTQESFYRVEIVPSRRRVFCMAVTASDTRDRGRPSSWSSTIDALAAGADAEGSPRRLVILSSGNTDPSSRQNYPDANLTDSIHDPAQAWNAVTVGGYTDKVAIDRARFSGWEPVAVRGDLAPASCTSVTWRRWPIKPDIVLEAGNMARNDAFPEPDYIDDSLQLLSTAHNFQTNKLLTSFGDTSASTALAARYAALVWSKYPGLAPETVRALLVHAADWTPAMLERFQRADGSYDYEALVRCFGRGVTNASRLLSSLDNSLTLLVESEFQPFFKDPDDDRVKTREMRLHPLPWPVEALQSLQHTPVRMKITLSYFVEPSPGARGWAPKYGYQSHGLRFAVRKPLESDAAFTQRVNKFGRDEDYEAQGISDPGWEFGHNMRSLTSIGSIHTDVWRGTAADLATRGHIAVYPTMGWWNKRLHLGAWSRSVHYSLLVTIETPRVDVDLYTPIANLVGIPVVVET